MSMPKIPDMNPDIYISRQDAVNIIITSIAMEELALAHILNAEGEKLQYVLGTLENRDPGEITICDIMAVNKSVHKTLRDVIKAEMLMQLKLEEVADLDESDNECQLTIRGQKIWRDGDNVAGSRPASVEIALLRDGEVYKKATVDPAGDGKYTFACLPVWRDATYKYTYTVDETSVPPNYTKTVNGYDVINTVEAGDITVTGTKIWVDNDNIGGTRPSEITVHLLQNGTIIRSAQVASPDDSEDRVSFNFTSLPQFDQDGVPFIYAVDEEEVAGYTKRIDGFTITNTL